MHLVSKSYAQMQKYWEEERKRLAASYNIPSPEFPLDMVTPNKVLDAFKEIFAQSLHDQQALAVCVCACARRTVHACCFCFFSFFARKKHYGSTCFGVCVCARAPPPWLSRSTCATRAQVPRYVCEIDE